VPASGRRLRRNLAIRWPAAVEGQGLGLALVAPGSVIALRFAFCGLLVLIAALLALHG